jgi:hypothetical protein
VVRQGLLGHHVDGSGISHHIQFVFMPTGTLKSSKTKKNISVVQDYDIAADAKHRISLRGAKAKYFNVKAFSNGSYLLEPRVLVRREAIPARTLKMLERSMEHFKKGKASAPIDLSPFIEG